MKKKSTFLGRLFCVTKETNYRIVYILGLKLKWKSRVLVLQNRIATLEYKMASIMCCGDFQAEYKYTAPAKQSGAQESTLTDLSKKIHSLEVAAQHIQEQDTKRSRELKNALLYKIYKYCAVEKQAVALADWYREYTGQTLNLENPQTYNEKIQWSKLYDSTPIKTRLADKYLVREWVAKRIGEKYLIPLLGVWEDFSSIDFDTLPERFALKCNHGSAYNIIVKDKKVFLEKEFSNAQNKFNAWMAEDFSFRAGFELHYSAIPRRIIAEAFIENKASKGDLYDYKFWCFDGKVKFIQFFSDRYITGAKTAFYDVSWKKQDFVCGYPLDTQDREKPSNLAEMIELAEKLAAGFNHVRVDFYRMDDGVLYFGEMTFTPFSGICKWIPSEMNQKMGELLSLPNI